MRGLGVAMREGAIGTPGRGRCRGMLPETTLCVPVVFSAGCCRRWVLPRHRLGVEAGHITPHRRRRAVRHVPHTGGTEPA
jgi:hypothetical protein